ncbi:MAG: hypothetical protein R2705_09465 [Ilumatobacteraceae bacterium]
MAISIDPIEDHRGWAPDITGEVAGTPLLNFDRRRSRPQGAVEPLRHDPSGRGRHPPCARCSSSTPTTSCAS